MSRGDIAKEYFTEGYNCSQSVAMAYADIIGINKDTVAKMTSGFGGGMGMGMGMGAPAPAAAPKAKNVIKLYLKKRVLTFVFIGICMVVLTCTCFLDVGMKLGTWLVGITNGLSI